MPFAGCGGGCRGGKAGGGAERRGRLLKMVPQVRPGCSGKVRGGPEKRSIGSDFRPAAERTSREADARIGRCGKDEQRRSVAGGGCSGTDFRPAAQRVAGGSWRRNGRRGWLKRDANGRRPRVRFPSGKVPGTVGVTESVPHRRGCGKRSTSHPQPKRGAGRGREADPGPGGANRRNTKSIKTIYYEVLCSVGVPAPYRGRSGEQPATE